MSAMALRKGDFVLPIRISGYLPCFPENCCLKSVVDCAASVLKIAGVRAQFETHMSTYIDDHDDERRLKTPRSLRDGSDDWDMVPQMLIGRCKTYSDRSQSM